MWLKIWQNTMDKVEEENPWALAFDETEEWDLPLLEETDIIITV